MKILRHVLVSMLLLAALACQQVQPAREADLPGAVIAGKPTGQSAGQAETRLEFIRRQADDIDAQAQVINKDGTAPESPVSRRLAGDTTRHARDLAVLKDQVAAANREANAAEARNAELQAEIVNLRDQFARLHQARSELEAKVGEIRGQLTAEIAGSTMWKTILGLALLVTNGAWLAWLFLVRR